jgi:hypothetical protein
VRIFLRDKYTHIVVREEKEENEKAISFFEIAFEFTLCAFALSFAILGG